MKRLLVLLAALCLLLASCANSGGTRIPTIDELQKNLDRAGYAVILTEDSSGTRLSAAKGAEFIEFCRPSDGGAEAVAAQFETLHPDYDRLISMENDARHGTFALCATDAAMDDAGIRIVDVKVKID